MADPRRHPELDGSGTVIANAKAPAEIVEGSRFSTKMKMFGLPYRITSTVTAFTPGVVFEWRHPFGHRWRWEFEQVDPRRTRVIETFDYHDAGAVKDRLRYYERTGFAKANSRGIEATLTKLGGASPSSESSRGVTPSSRDARPKTAAPSALIDSRSPCALRPTEQRALASFRCWRTAPSRTAESGRVDDRRCQAWPTAPKRW